jgi:hypothetical protein
MPRPAQKKMDAVPLCRTETRRGREVSSMSIQEYVVRQADGLWQVRFDGRLIGGRSTRLEAMNMADCFAQRSTIRGYQSRVVVIDSDDGSLLTLPSFGHGDQT